MSKRIFDESFKKMAIELSYARAWVKEGAEELGIDPGRISKWRQEHNLPKKATGRADRRAKRDQKAAKRAEGGSARTGYFKKGGKHLFQGRGEIVGFIKGDQNRFAARRDAKGCLG